MREIWEWILAFLDYFGIANKIFSVVLFFTSVFLFFRYFGYRYKKPLLYIFKKSYLFGFFYLSKMAISFRKSPSYYTRLFCEYLIIKLKGDELTLRELKRHHVTFVQNHVKRDDLRVHINSTFEALEITSKDHINRYFDYFSKPKNMKTYEIDGKEILTFIFNLHIDKGYLLASISIPGLQDHYNDNWSSIINRYLSSLKEDTNQNELFMFYTWLMWGPSYMPTYRKLEYKIMQYGMGDESKTIPIILDTSNKSIELWNQLLENINNRNYGFFCGLNLKIYEKSKFFEKNSDMFNNEIAPFVTKIINSSGPIVFVHQSNTVSITANQDSKFFSAYIWTLFVKTQGEIPTENFDISNCVAFFEHANLAEQENYNFLLTTLVAKIIRHLEAVAKTSTETYYLNTSMNQHIHRAICEEITQRQQEKSPFGNWLKTNVILKPILTIGTLLDRFDEQFSMHKLSLTIEEIKLDSNKSIELLSKFYVSTYLGSFPDENERETLDNFLLYLKNEQLGYNQHNHYHILVATINGEIAGGIVADYFKDINSGVFEFIVVNKEYRRNQVGARLIEEMTNILNRDARKHGKNAIDYLFIETDNPKKTFAGTREQALKTVEFWRRQKFKALKFDYIQPSIDSGKESVEHLFLAVKIVNRELNENVLDNKILKSFLYDYAKYAMSIKEPFEDPIIKRNYANIANNDVELEFIDLFIKNDN